jgi:hypothetical protein
LAHLNELVIFDHTKKHSERRAKEDSPAFGPGFSSMIGIQFQDLIDRVSGLADCVTIRGLELNFCQLLLGGGEPIDPVLHWRFSRSARIAASDLPPPCCSRRFNSSSLRYGCPPPLRIIHGRDEVTQHATGRPTDFNCLSGTGKLGFHRVVHDYSRHELLLFLYADAF